MTVAGGGWWRGVVSAFAFALGLLPLLVSGAESVGRLIATPPTATAALELKDLSGKVHRLSDYRGKVVLVNFWATWCEPCLEEMPSMQRLHDRLGAPVGGDVVVLAVNYAENRPRIDQFLQRQVFTFPILLDGFSEAWRAWKPGMLPASFLLGRDGRLRYRILGEFDWAGPEADAAIRRLLADKPA